MVENTVMHDTVVRGRMDRVHKVLSSILVTFALLLWVGTAQAQGGSTQYIYDANGRLSAVIAPSGAAAIYRYDAAGNLTSIDQIALGGLSILSFSPQLGTVGDQVTLAGTGLDTVSTVSFNGVSSQIISTTTTSLTTTVPADGSSGPITVSGARGSFTSTDSFVVVARVDVSPSIVEVLPNETVQFQAVVVGTTDQQVAWSVNGISGGNAAVGTVNANGLYVAPNINTGLTVTVSAVSAADVAVSGQGSVRILNPNTTSELRSLGLIVSRGVAANSQAFSSPVSVARSNFTNDFVAAASVTVEKGSAVPAIARLVAVEFGASVPLSSPPVSATTGPVTRSISPATFTHGAAVPITITGQNLGGVSRILFLPASTGAPDTTITITNISTSPDGQTLTFTATSTAGTIVGTDVIQVTTPNGSTPVTNLGNNVMQIQ
jgi:YD repeat-containing protein